MFLACFFHAFSGRNRTAAFARLAGPDICTCRYRAPAALRHRPAPSAAGAQPNDDNSERQRRAATEDDDPRLPGRR